MDVRQLPANWIIGAATLQSICLFLIYRGLEEGAWLAETPVLSFPLIAVVVSLPLLFMLLVEDGFIKALLVRLTAVGVVIAGLGAYLGSQAMPVDEVGILGLAATGIISLIVGLFHLSAYLKANAEALPYRYPALFRQSWRSFLIPALAAAMVGLLALVMFLSAQLFKLIGIDVLDWMQGHAWFNLPVYGITFGVGVLTFRRLDTVIASITELLKGLMTLLLPLVLSITLLFLCSLPFTGLASLWQTGSGTSLVLWLLAIALFMTNAVYQDDCESSPYPAYLDAGLRYSMLALPVLAGIAVVGIYQRIDQYGFTVERSWAMVITAMLAGFSLGYAVQVLIKGDEWRRGMAQVNTVMGLCLVVALALTSSPALDFRKLSVWSQMSRLDKGEVAIDKFDFSYLQQLAKPGRLATLSLRERYAADASVIALMDQQSNDRQFTAQPLPLNIWDSVIYRPVEFNVPDAIREQISRSLTQDPSQPFLIQVDLNSDGVDDYALLQVVPGQSYIRGILFTYRGGKWGTFNLTGLAEIGQSGDLIKQLREGGITAELGEFRNLLIGGIDLQVQQNAGSFRIFDQPGSAAINARGSAGTMFAQPMNLPLAPSEPVAKQPSANE
jgi:hypothetical protein